MVNKNVIFAGKMETKDYWSFVSDTLSKLKSTINILEMVVGELYQRTQYDPAPVSFVNVAPQLPNQFIHGHQFVANQGCFQHQQQPQKHQQQQQQRQQPQKHQQQQQQYQHQLQQQFQHQPQYHQPQQQETQNQVISSEAQANTVLLDVHAESTTNFLNQSLDNMTAIVDELLTFGASDDNIYKDMILNTDQANADVSSSSGVSSTPS